MSGQASSPVRVRHALGVATARADDFVKQGDYIRAAEAENEVRTLTEMLKDVKVQYEMVCQAQKKLQIAVKHAERKREWLDVAKFKKLQETINEKLQESRERGAERQREAELLREAEKAKEAAAREAKDLEARAARVREGPPVREDAAAELAPHLHESERQRIAARTYDLKGAEEKGNRGKGINSECSREQFEKVIKKKYTFEGVEYPNLHGHSLVHDAGHLYCVCCCTRINFYHARQHCHGEHHTEKLVWFNRHGAEMRTIAQHVEETQKANSLPGQTLDSETKAFRGEVLCFAADGNYSISSLNTTRRTIENWAGLQMGDPAALQDLTPALHEVEMTRIREDVQSCFPVYGATWDGDPLYAEAEVLYYRGIRVRDWKIMNLCIGIKLLKKSPKARTLFLSIESLLQRCGLSFDGMRVAMVDRARTNLASLRIIGEERNGRVLGAYCGSHNIGNCGKQFEGDDLNSFLHYFKEIVMHPGGARLRFLEVFGKAAKSGTGVRWFIEHELVAQLNSIGLDSIVEWASWCAREGYSETSAKKLVALARDPLKMAKVYVQAAARHNAGDVLCKGCYNLEGDNPLVFIAHSEYRKIEGYMEIGTPLPLLEPASVKAEGLVRPLVAAAEANWRAALDLQARLRTELEALEVKLAAASAGPTEGRRVQGKRNYAQLANSGRLEEPHETEQARLSREVNKKKADLTAADDDVAAKATAKDERLVAIGPKTAAEFAAIGRDSVAPAFAYYRHLYLEPGGDMFELRQAFRGASVLDPLKLAGMNANEVKLLIQDLRYFRFPELTPQVIEGLASEANLLLAQATMPFDWGAVNGAADYDSSVMKRLTGEAAPEAPAPSEAAAKSAWMQDPGERARRIWEWWVTRLRGQDYFTHFKLMLPIIVLVQSSSAIVERANSRLKRIIDCIGENGLAETLEFRAFRALNR